MNIYRVLENDHRRLNELLDRLVKSSNEDQEKWKKLVDEIRDELVPHSRAEEAVFYNAIRELDSNNGVVGRSYMEHAMAETDLRTLQAMKAIDVNSAELAMKFRNDVLRHIQEEEDQVFSTARTIFTDEEAKLIGNAFKELKPIVKNQSFIGTTLDLISNLLPRRLVPGFRKYFSKEHKTAA